MADEDEIDVLGEFNLGNFLSKDTTSLYDSASLVSQNTELLNCDFTIHPQWLLDKPSANPDNWYDSNISTGLVERIQIETEVLGHVSTENSITDESGWTEKEKNLLERGIEIFGKSNVRLSQFIGSKTASEVKYYLKNFYMENHHYRSISETIIGDVTNTDLVADVLDDTQIPASIEEVIAAVSTAKPTVPMHGHKPRKKSCSLSESQSIGCKDLPAGQSILKTNLTKKGLEATGKEKRNKKYEISFKRKKSKVTPVKFKFKTKLKVPLRDLRNKESKTTLKQKTVKVINEHNNRAEYSKVEITTGKGLAVPICEGEEIVKLKNVENDSDTDMEIDVELSDEESVLKTIVLKSVKQSNQVIGPTEQSIPKDNLIQPCSIKVKTVSQSENKCKQSIDMSTLNESTIQLLTCMDEPKCEFVLDENIISEFEKVINSEYFEGKASKTPARYINIRNHILKGWRAQKPNYLKKTLSRKGLKNCGDVNCFGRIHLFLEQIGAINFGCDQVIYSRPLSDLIQDQPMPREKNLKDIKNFTRQSGELGSRPRNKNKKFTNDGEGGCTLTHDEEGHVINTTVINEEPVLKQRLYIKKPTIQLIYCRPFTEDNPQPYKIKMNLSTLLTMDFHAHTSLTEVMGLVAGYWILDSKILEITHYEPCVNIASSATHCDMCPISQAKAAEFIHENGLDILGWFHSHPTFAPEPSQQDLDTQQSVQQWIGHNKPCIGVILNPFCLNGALIASPLRCMVVDKKVNFEDQFVPYKFKVQVVTDDFVVREFIKDLKRIFRADLGGTKPTRIDFTRPYFHDSTITYLEKYIMSVRMHLAKCGTLNKMTCDTIIQEIVNICSNRLN